MAEILSIISLVSYIVAGICFALAILFWFVFKIPTVIGDLSGRTARKSIAQMRENNEKSGGKIYKSSSTNVNRGKLTGTMPQTGEPEKAEDGQRVETGLLTENKADHIESEETGMLESEETGLLYDEEETVSLEQSPKPTIKRTGGKKLVVLEEVMLVHTEEVIT